MSLINNDNSVWNAKELDNLQNLIQATFDFVRLWNTNKFMQRY